MAKAATLYGHGEMREVRHVAGYVRVSTEYQKRSGLGLEAQRMKIDAMSVVKGWPRPIVFADEGISGAKETADREQLRRLMQAIRDGEIDAVIVNSIDRLARNARLMLSLAEDMQEYGVQLVSCKESIDTATPAGKLVFTVLAAMAQFERDLASERTKAALDAHNIRDGERGGRLPYGYRRSDEGLEVVEEQAKAIRAIFALRKRGASLREIVRVLHHDGYAPPRGNGPWWASSVRDVLSQKLIYRGSKRGASEVRWPAILGR